jgi:hypothetical protein
MTVDEQGQKLILYGHQSGIILFCLKTMSVLSIYELGYDIVQKRNSPPEKTGEIMSLHVSKLQNDTDINLKLIILFNYGLFSVDLPLAI